MSPIVELNHVVADEGPARSPPPRIGRLVDRLVSGGRGDRGSPPDVLWPIGTCLHAPVDPSRGVVDLAAIPLDLVAGVPGTVVRVGGTRSIGAAALRPPLRFRGRAVLIRTGWDARWGTGSYLEAGPFLTEEAAQLLVGAGARIVGVDFWNVDEAIASSRPVRSCLLEGGIPLVENLTNLKALPRDGFRFSAVPLRIDRGASILVRAFAEADRGTLRM